MEQINFYFFFLIKKKIQSQGLLHHAAVAFTKESERNITLSMELTSWEHSIMQIFINIYNHAHFLSRTIAKYVIL